VSGRNIPARDSLEVEDVQRIAGAIDGAIDVLQRSRFYERLNAWQAGIQGTRRQIFYECAPSIHGDQQVAPQKEVGIDLGLEHIATTSDGEKLLARHFHRNIVGGNWYASLQAGEDVNALIFLWSK
jgi:transposase